MINDSDNAETGNHWKLKFIANSHLLHDEALMSEFLYALVDCIGAKALRDPVVDNVVLRLRDLGEEPWADEGGISGIITLSVSHIACHTWPKHNENGIMNEDGGAVCDVYSCREFDVNDVAKVISEKYNASRIQALNLSFALQWG